MTDYQKELRKTKIAITQNKNAMATIEAKFARDMQEKREKIAELENHLQGLKTQAQ